MYACWVYIILIKGREPAPYVIIYYLFNYFLMTSEGTYYLIDTAASFKWIKIKRKSPTKDLFSYTIRFCFWDLYFYNRD